MMGAAMLKHHRFVRSLWGLAEMCTRGSQAQPLLQTKHAHYKGQALLLSHLIG